MEDQNVWIAYSISNVLAFVFLWASIKRPKLARLLLFFLFGWASWFNYTTAHQQPEAYLMYADHAIGFYADFINGWFRNHLTFFVSFIAIGQGLIALGMLLRAWWVKLACIGAVVFLLGIAPLGFYSAFPFSITLSIAIYFVWRKDDFDYLWRFRKEKSKEKS